MRKILMGLALLATAAGAAEPEKPPAPVVPVAVRAQLVQLSDEAAGKLSDGARLRSGALDGARVLQTQEVLTVTGQDGLLFVGHKSPIIYYDPRASQFQVQYVDTGVKLDIRVMAEANEALRVECHSEYGKTEVEKTAGASVYPQTVVLQSFMNLTGVHYGETYVVGRMEGVAARQYLEGLKGASPANGNHLLTVLTVVQP